MIVEIAPKKLMGEMKILSSKSDGHRLLICAALGDKKTEVKINNESEDIDATINCLSALGAEFKKIKGGYEVIPLKEILEYAQINPGESGSTLRFLLPVTAALVKRAYFTGKGRLPERPLEDLQVEMKKNGVSFSNKFLPFYTEGILKSGIFKFPGNVSSQYISGILLAAPLLKGKVTIEIDGKLESSSYVDMTIDSLKKFGVEVVREAKGYTVESSGYKSPGTVEAEGDFSNGAFFLAAGALSGPVTVKGLSKNTLQGDAKIIDILEARGAILKKNDGLTFSRGEENSVDVDLSQTPDLLPILAIVAAFSKGQSRFYNGKRLKLKETDRLKTTAKMIKDLGGRAEVTEDGLIVEGTGLKGGRTSSFADHRIAMAASIASCRAEESIIIERAEAVNKSYPNFFEDLKKIGGDVNVINIRE
ncbi:3-phosphoshikimate 1-carboxyvinyltransferase [Peptoniphilus sp. ING2-D1G]|nr:3-phosphoshikimate 1-carboxyvinyltransferase [Peptoniphilus sp. ING2-D1G]